MATTARKLTVEVKLNSNHTMERVAKSNGAKFTDDELDELGVALVNVAKELFDLSRKAGR